MYYGVYTYVYIYIYIPEDRHELKEAHDGEDALRLDAVLEDICCLY